IDGLQKRVAMSLVADFLEAQARLAQGLCKTRFCFLEEALASERLAQDQPEGPCLSGLSHCGEFASERCKPGDRSAGVPGSQFRVRPKERGFQDKGPHLVGRRRHREEPVRLLKCQRCSLSEPRGRLQGTEDGATQGLPLDLTGLRDDTNTLACHGERSERK